MSDKMSKEDYQVDEDTKVGHSESFNGETTRMEQTYLLHREHGC